MVENYTAYCGPTISSVCFYFIQGKQARVPVWQLTSIISLANLVLEDTWERIYHKDAVAQEWHGILLIRGENVVLLGEIVSAYDRPHINLTMVSLFGCRVSNWTG